MKTIAYSFLALCLTVSPGLAQTYVTLSGSYGDYTLQSGTTYYLSNNVTLTGTTVIEGGAVIKYAAGKSLTVSDSILCTTSPWHPAVFTAKDDDTVGETIAGSSGSPMGYYATTALRLPAAGGSVLNDLRFRHARTAVAVGSVVDGVYPEDVLNCVEFKHCDSGVAVTGPDGSTTGSLVGGSQTSGIGGGGDGVHARGVELLNVLFSEGSQVITGRVAHVNVFWLTVDQAAYVAYGSDVDVLVRESVLASVSHAGGGGAAISGSYNGYYHSTNAAFGTSPNYATTNYPFQNFGGNAYYLTNGSPFVDAGGEMAMDAGLQNYTTQTNQSPDTGLVDLGYHFRATGKDSTGTDFWVGFPYMVSDNYNLSLYISSVAGATGTVTALSIPTTLIVTNCGDETVNGMYVLTNLSVAVQAAMTIIFDGSSNFGYAKGTNQIVFASGQGNLIGYDSNEIVFLYYKDDGTLDGNNWHQEEDENPYPPTTIGGAPVSITWPFSVAAGTATNIAIPPSVMILNNNAIGTNGIHIVTSQPVSVYAMNHDRGASVAFTCYPTPLLGTNYCLMSRPSYSSGSSEFGLMATEDNTTIIVTNSTGYFPSIVLQQGENYQVNASDVTGIWVTADKPVAVFAGDSSAHVPSWAEYTNPLIQEQLPVEDWGTNVVALSFAGRLYGDRYRILAAYDNTAVRITNGFGFSVVTNLVAGTFCETNLDGWVWIQADKPIQVAQFANGHDFDGVTNNPNGYPEADPCEILLLPAGHYLQTNIVVTGSGLVFWIEPPLGFDQNYLNLIVPLSANSATYVDGSLLAETNFMAIGSSGYYGARISVTNGTHTVTSSQPVSVMVYGWGYYNAYGCFGGFVK